MESWKGRETVSRTGGTESLLHWAHGSRILEAPREMLGQEPGTQAGSGLASEVPIIQEAQYGREKSRSQKSKERA